MYVFFCQMPKTKARSGTFQKVQIYGAIEDKGTLPFGLELRAERLLHHFETTHYCEFIGHYKKRHTYAPFMNPKVGIMSK